MTIASSHQLTMFVAVAKHRNISRAARELHVTQSAVSHDLKLLRDMIGVPLTKRNRRGIELTEAGEVIRLEAELLLVQLGAFGSKYRTRAAVQAEQTLTIGASHGPSSRIVPLLLTRFRREFSHVRLIHRIGTSEKIEELLLKRTVDIAFISHPSNLSGMIIESFAAERVIFVVAKSDRFAKNPKITTAELAQLPFLIRNGKDGSSSTIKFLHQALSKRIKLHVAMEFDNPSTLKSAVINGAGVGVLYEDMVADELRNGSLQKLTLVGANLDGQSHLVYLRDRTLSPVAMKFVEFSKLHRGMASSSDSPAKSPSGRVHVASTIGRKHFTQRDSFGVLTER